MWRYRMAVLGSWAVLGANGLFAGQLERPASIGLGTFDFAAEDGTPRSVDGSSDRCDVGCGRPAPCVPCDGKKEKELKAAVAGAHKSLFYDNDFGYLCDPCYCGWWPGDHLKRRAVADWITLDVGGQYRARHHSERNHRGLGLTGRDDDFLLHRTRLYLNAEVGHRFRAYAEYIDAESNYEQFGPRPIEVNRSDLQNLFGDLLLYDGGGGQLWVRGGRQELLYGAERTVSPLDWANTRRTFEGYKIFWKGENWRVDAFYTRPIFPNAKRFDSPNFDQELMGVYSTYRGRQDQTLDLYYLRYNNSAAPNRFKFNTLGSRWQGSREPWLWEAEGAVQFGDNTDGSDHSAGAFTLGLGRTFPCLGWKPTLWVYYDWASGDSTTGNGYHHLFPLSHKYMGFMDLFGRRNLEDTNVRLTLQPHEKLKLLGWWHLFYLQDGDDVPYNVVMTPSPALPGVTIVPGGSQYLGQELDLVATWTINARMNLLLGYSHFWSGSWFATNGSALPFRGDADFFYTQYQLNF